MQAKISHDNQYVVLIFDEFVKQKSLPIAGGSFIGKES
jgi:hypothetical protein